MRPMPPPWSHDECFKQVNTLQERLVVEQEHSKILLDAERKRSEILMEQVMRLSSHVLDPIWTMSEVLRQEKSKQQTSFNEFADYITPTKGETKLNVKENAGAMLGQVQSHLADIEGKLKQSQERIKSLEAERSARHQVVDHRALYLNLDGSTKNLPVMAGPEGPLREVRFEEFTPGSVHYIEDPRRYGTYIKPIRRIYQLAFTQGSKLHVYREV